MTNENVDPLWVTHIRVVAVDATCMPSPEIRGLARMDLGVGAQACAYDEPVARRFATAADTPTRKLTACTPPILAATLWTPHPPDAVAVFGAAAWDVFPPAVSLGIARIDMCKVARVVWPGAPSSDLISLIGYVRPDLASATCPAGGHQRLLWEVRAIANLVMAAAMVAGEVTIRHAEALGLPATSQLDEAFEGMRGDRALQAFATITSAPMAPGMCLPAPWDDPRGWFVVASEDLQWLANSETTSDYTREAAEAEIARRAKRDADLVRPRMLLRRTSWN